MVDAGDKQEPRRIAPIMAAKRSSDLISLCHPLALTAVQVRLLKIYDMCKAIDRGMVTTDVRVPVKHGGKSGDWVA